MKVINAFLLASIAILFGFGLLVPSGNALAQAPTPLTSVLSISAGEPVPVGQRPVVHARLANEAGLGVPNKPLIVYLENQRVRRIRTDEKGEAVIYFSRELATGTYQVAVEFEGTEAYQASRAEADLTIRPAILTIETFPSLPGLEFSLGDKRFTSNQAGIATILVDKAGTYPLEALLPTDTKESRTAFERWGDESFDAVRQVEINNDRKLQAGFALFYPVQQVFVDLNGDPVDPERIDTLTLKSSFGASYTLDDGQARLFQVNRIARRKTGLEATPVQYSTESVIIDGTNVVNQYQQRFFVKPGDTWTIELLLYYAHIEARDAVLGFSVGDGISLEYPSGRTETLSFDQDGTLVVGPLARGIYRLQVTGVKGMAPLTPVALSRDQEVELKVLTNLDIGLGLGLGVIVALGMLIYGRPQIVLVPVRYVSTIRLRAGKAPRVTRQKTAANS